MHMHKQLPKVRDRENQIYHCINCKVFVQEKLFRQQYTAINAVSGIKGYKSIEQSTTCNCSLTYLSVVMINHDIVRLNISVHDSHTVTVVQGLN